MGESAARYTADQLLLTATGLLAGSGAPTDIAETVASLLVWSERIGHTSHGLLRIPQYVERIRAGRLRPDARPLVSARDGAVTTIDGAWGFGQLTAMTAVEEGVERARELGASVTGAFHINHIGRLGDFTEMAAREGMVAMLFVGGAPSGTGGNVAPYGGKDAVWGTNPLAIAVPGTETVFSLDFATSIVAGGKVAAASARGARLDDDYLIDVHGNPSSDPTALAEGGAIRPFGEHKGYALAFAVELLAGSMVGALAPELRPGEMHNGLLLIVIDPDHLGSHSRFLASVDAVMRDVKASVPAVGFDEVLIPGEPERRNLVKSDAGGLEVPPRLRAELNSLAEEFGVSIEW